MELSTNRAILFDQAAEQYDTYRPSYPKILIEKMLNLSKISNSSRILEIGCGTGKATVMIAPQGCVLDCIDPGERLLAIAKVRCKEWPNVSFIKGKFDELELKRNYYDLVFAAQSFHWTNPKTRWNNCKKILLKCGSVAILRNHPIPPNTKVGLILAKVIHQESHGIIEPDPVDFTSEDDNWILDMESSGFFEKPLIYRMNWSRRLSAEEYAGLFSTYSDFLSLSVLEQKRIKEAIIKVIGENGGSYDYLYESVLIHGRLI